MTAHEDDADSLCSRCGVSFDIHEYFSPECQEDDMADPTPDAAKLPLGHAFVRHLPDYCGHYMLWDQPGEGPRHRCGHPESAHLSVEAPRQPSAEDVAIERLARLCGNFTLGEMAGSPPNLAPGALLVLRGNVRHVLRQFGDGRAHEQDRVTRLECAKKVCRWCAQIEELKQARLPHGQRFANGNHKHSSNTEVPCRAVELGILPAEEK